jgi:FkbM family methyltransferase
MIRKLAKTATALNYPGGWHAIWGARPRSATSWVMANQLKALCGSFHTILDGGANVGQFARAAHMCFPEARLISFEPLPDVADQHDANLADVPNRRMIRMALGDYDGETLFFRNSFDQSSSVLPMLTKHGGMHEGLREVEELHIPIARLDTALAGETLVPSVLLKLDLQGNELAALKGGEATLAACSHVLLETVFEQEYEGEPLFEALWVHLRERGFAFNRPLNFVRNKAGAIIQMDALFARSGTTGAVR